MNTFLVLAFLFFIGSTVGWGMELLFRRVTNPQHKWINPGFCTGPYLPFFGCGLCLLYLIASVEPVGSTPWHKLLLFVSMAASMTVIEYVGGYLSLKYFHVRLWDYRGMWGNLNGIICPQFSCIWAGLGAIYYWLIHPYILNALHWLSRNLSFSFFIGFFFGVFFLDVCHALQVMGRLRAFAERNQLILKYEAIKDRIRGYHEETRSKYHFFRPFQSDRPLHEHLKEMGETFERGLKKRNHTRSEKEP